MILVYLENGEHKELEIDKIETTINDDDLMITIWKDGTWEKKIIEKKDITSINVKY